MHLPHVLPPFVFLLIVFGIVVAALASKKGTRSSRIHVSPRRPFLSDREQSMYHRLLEAWPNGYVLTQVAMGALLKSPATGDRNRFAQKISDFVLTDKAFQVRLIIELDDSSHRSKKGADFLRDELLQSAGYETRRFDNVPDLGELVAILKPLSSPV